jgi:hypothetical protein
MGEKALNSIYFVRQIASSALHRHFKVRIDVARTTLVISILAIAAFLSACSTSTPTTTSVAQQIAASSTPNPTATSSPTITQSATSMPQVSATPTSLDPCVLIDSAEATSLAGTTFGAGVEGTLPGGGRTCTYGSQLTNMFFVEVVQAPDTATADTAQKQFLSDIQANMQQLTSEGFNVTQLPNFADGGIIGQATINAGGVTVNISAIGFRKGTIFFGFSDVVFGGAAPSSDALQNEATTVLGRLP